MISIVIPTLNEADKIRRLLQQLNQEKESFEVIVADGGSRDGTLEAAGCLAHVHACKKRGRGAQMNEGASRARGQILWFLHADSLVEPGCLTEILKCMETDAVGGGFSLGFYDADCHFMRFVAHSSNTRARRLGLIFGDQGLFVRREVFSRMGGFPEIPIMEDWAFSRSLHREGAVAILSARLWTSARRFHKNGRLKTLMHMHEIKIKYILGVPPEKLAAAYKEIR